MVVQALPGNVRFRAYQLGLQSDLLTRVNATRRVPWRFTPTVDPHWTFPDVDTGTLDPAIAPYRMALDVTGQAAGPISVTYGSLKCPRNCPSAGRSVRSSFFRPLPSPWWHLPQWRSSTPCTKRWRSS